MQKVIFISPLPYVMETDITALTSMISNNDLTEMCELLILMWTALVQVTITVVSIKALMLLIFCFVGVPILVRTETYFCKQKPKCLVH